jgi:murein DD-endopeptidase MepM/ murein hydrolase activator NlpD
MKYILKKIAPIILILFIIMIVQYFKFLSSVFSHSGTSEEGLRSSQTIIVDFRSAASYQIIPYYIDLNKGDSLKIIKSDSSTVLARIEEISIDSNRYSCPRTRILFNINGETKWAYCGMKETKRGGIEPLKTNGINIGIEITRLLFSRIGTKKGSPFNTFANFQLNKDIRVAVWETDKPILQLSKTAFILDQLIWTRSKFGNWLHGTSYGFHSAIDIFASRHGVPEAVYSPVEGIVYNVYHKGGNRESRRNSKAINIYGKDFVGPHDEQIFFRFQHFSKIVVSKGQELKAGQLIGFTGHTGFDPKIGDHLHFEIRLNPSCFGKFYNDNIFDSIPVNPYFYLLQWWNQKHNAKRYFRVDL